MRPTLSVIVGIAVFGSLMAFLNGRTTCLFVLPVPESAVSSGAPRPCIRSASGTPTAGRWELPVLVAALAGVVVGVILWLALG